MRGRRLLLLLVLVSAVRADMFHYYKLKKFMTAVAFARALGKRPAILPIPIPIPIPIAQNEVIKVPAGSSKTILSMMGSPKYPSKGISFIGGGGGGKYTGSSHYGYPLPGHFESSYGGGGGDSKVVVLNGNDHYEGVGGSEFASPSNIVRLVSGGASGLFKKPKRYIVLNGNSGMSGGGFGGSGMMSGGGFGGSGMMSGGGFGGSGMMRNSESIPWLNSSTDWLQPAAQQIHSKKSSPNSQKKPIPVGEKFRLP